MPRLTGDQIRDISFHVLRAAGASGNNARVVAEHLAGANLAGHDSHGFIRITQYVEDIRNGTIDAKAEPTVAQDHGGLVQVDGNGTFGQVVAARATGLAIERARQNGVATVTMTNLDHTGRIGTYPEMVAVEGMAAIMVTGVVGGTSGMNVAPFGGTRRKLGTNPIAIGFPYLPDSPMLLDFATSVSAEGKLRVYRNRGHLLPSAWVIDKDGEPSNDPNDYYEGGSILPLGGVESGHKGYALSVMVALLGAIAGGLGFPQMDIESGVSGSSITVIDVGRLAPQGAIRARVSRTIDVIKDTPLAKGAGDVLYPGEMEATTRRERMANGVDIEEATWNPVAALIEELGVADSIGPIG